MLINKVTSRTRGLMQQKLHIVAFHMTFLVGNLYLSFIESWFQAVVKSHSAFWRSSWMIVLFVTALSLCIMRRHTSPQVCGTFFFYNSRVILYLLSLLTCESCEAVMCLYQGDISIQHIFQHFTDCWTEGILDICCAYFTFPFSRLCCYLYTFCNVTRELFLRNVDKVCALI